MMSVAGANGMTTLQQLQLLNQGLQQLGHARDLFTGAGDPDAPEEIRQQASAPLSWLGYFTRAQEELQAEDQEEIEDVANVTDSQQKTYLLRMCVHSAQHLAREKSFVTTIVGEGSHERKFHTELSEETAHPIWEHCFEQEVVFAERAPTVQFKIYGKRSLRLKDRLLGTATVRLSRSVTDGPRRQQLKVQTPQGLLQSCVQCRPPLQPVLHVVWQQCECAAVDFRPDLNRVAALDQAATEKETFCLVTKVFGLYLRRHETQKKVNIIVKLRKPEGGNSHSFPTRLSPPVLIWPKGEAYERMNDTVHASQARDILGCVEACWPANEGSGEDTGYELEPWTIRESQMMLLSYFLEVTLQEVTWVPAEPEGSGFHDSTSYMPKRPSVGRRRSTSFVEKPIKVGSWREPLGDIKDAIDQLDQRLWFDAELMSRDGHNIGRLRMEVDIFTDNPHRAPPLLTKHLSKASAAIPATSNMTAEANPNLVSSTQLMQVMVRRGMPPHDTWQQKVSYHCAVFADGLPNLDRCNPFVKITITGAGGTSSAQTDVKTEHQVNNIGWTSSLLITTKLVNRKAKVELFNNNAQTNFISSSLGLTPQGELLCEGTIYDVAPEKVYWLHCYGGALNAPKKEIASSMVRGAVRPPSTYQGTVVVHFGSRRQPQNYYHKLMEQREERKLVVRLHMGTNFQSYAKPGGIRRVKVMFQVAGCRLPDYLELQRLQRDERRRLTGEEDIEDTICCSPETLDETPREGQEGFMPDPTHFNRNLLAFPGEVDETGMLRFKETAMKTSGWQVQPNCSWVERWTPADIPLLVPPGVTHAYFYVVADGEEDKPPGVFGRFRLGAKPPADVRPRWKRARFDTSVRDLPESHFRVNIAGFLLGSAALVSEGRERFLQPRDRGKAPRLPDGVDASVVLPRATSSTLFPCCSADIAVSVGSPGEEVTCQPERPECRRKVYCHIDVLGARELPAMDDDGLIDPCYRIQVLDKEITQTGGVPKSMSPSFMHRVVIPFEIEVEDGDNVDTLVSTNIPMPPVVLRVLDYDDKKLFGQTIGSEFEEAGAVVVKHAAAEDGKYRMLGHGTSENTAYSRQHGPEFLPGKPEEQSPLDLNKIHSAVWYALDKSASIHFDAHVGSIDFSWFQRPRLLLAVGYSLQREIGENQVGAQLDSPEYFSSRMRRDGAVYRLQTPESACFQINVNLLGLRSLPAGLSNTRLQVSSFWPGEPVEFDIGSHFLGVLDKNPTFPHDSWEQGLEASKRPVRRDLYKAHLRGADTQILGITWVEQDDGSLLITNLWPDSCCEQWNQQSAANQRIRAGDVIIQIDGDAVALDEKLSARQHVVELNIARGEPWRAFAHKVKDIIHICQGHEASLEEEEHGAPTVFLEELKGVRISAPMYRVPVIPYLQRDPTEIRKVSSRGSMEIRKASSKGSLDSRPSHRSARARPSDSSDPFVLLPAIIFQLKNHVAGTDYGTLTVGLNRLMQKEHGPWKQSWMEIVLDEYEGLPQELKTWACNAKGVEETGRIHPVRGLRIDDDAYSVFMDVFASEAGYLTFDPDFRIGRPLSEQRLFTISKSRLGREEEVPQFLNPGDWMAGNPTYMWEPFDSRVIPSLWCGKWVGDEPERQSWPHRWLMKEEDLRRMCVPRKDLQLNKPKGPSELLHDTFSGLTGKAPLHAIRRGMSGKVKVGQATTGELRKQLKSEGWRATSHLIAPETDQEKNALFTDLIRSGGLSGSALKANLHTFLRPVGHIVHDRDRDSRILARLRLGLPAKYVTELLSRLRRDTEELESVRSAVSLQEGRELNEEEDEKIQRLTKSTELLESRKNNLMRAEEHTVNFLLIKFKKRGTVIWAAPSDVYMWCKPGMLLFVVQLTDQPDVNVPVFVPSFDIRQRFETMWTPAKTLVERGQHMEDRIRLSERKGNRSEVASEKRRKRRRYQVPLAAQDPEDASDESSCEELSADDLDDPNGYSRPIAVSKYAFVCRIRRGQRAMCFDRAQTRNWYQAVLEDTFSQELEGTVETSEAAAVPPERETKDRFLSRFVNLMKPLATRLEETATATIKGHITCQRVKDPFPGREVEHGENPSLRTRTDWASVDYGSSRALPLCTAPAEVQAQGRAVENLWIQQRVFVYCCVLTGHDFELHSLGLAGSLKPYLVARVGDEPAQKMDYSEDHVRLGAQETVHFYNNFVFETTLPGVASMNIEVWHQGLLGTTLVGACEVDIEDRWLALKRREFREGSHKDYLKSSISPETVRYFQSSMKHCPETGWVDPPADPEEAADKDGPGKEVLKPMRAPGQRMPIELRDLVRLDEESGTEYMVGFLRFWVDIMPIGDHTANVLEVWKPLDFEIRIIIWRIDNISIFKDFGERNDVYVKGCFRHTDFLGRETVKSDKTDVHHFANTEALFNWRWVFSVQAPARECSLELTMMDEDRIAIHEAIYHPVVYSLDHMLGVAYSNAVAGRRPLGVLQDTVVFDKWDEDVPVRTCLRRVFASCYRRSKISKRKFAHMRMDVQIVPVEEGRHVPAEAGNIAPPRDRLNISSAISNPRHTLQILIGARNYWKLYFSAAFCFVLVLLLLVAALAFFVANVGLAAG